MSYMKIKFNIEYCSFLSFIRENKNLQNSWFYQIELFYTSNLLKSILEHKHTSISKIQTNEIICFIYNNFQRNKFKPKIEQNIDLCYLLSIQKLAYFLFCTFLCKFNHL